MATLKEIFNFENSKYAPLRDSSRAVVKAYQDANRFFDTAQEYVYIEAGMKFFSRIIHNQAHEFPKRFDKFGDMLHERHLMVEYPSTPELNWKEEFKDGVNDVFPFLIRVLDNIQEALDIFHSQTDNANFRPMALFAEELMAENSADYTKLLELWARWDKERGSYTSFDSWCEKMLNNEEEE